MIAGILTKLAKQKLKVTSYESAYANGFMKECENLKDFKVQVQGLRYLPKKM